MRMLLLLIVIVVIGYFLTPWFTASLSRARTTTAAANVKLFADAIERAKSSGIRGPGTYGFSKEKALAWYREKGLITEARDPDMSQIAFRDGVWLVIPTAANAKELYASVAPRFHVNWNDFLQAQGYSTIEAAQAEFGNLDDWALRNGYFSFNALVYENYGGRISILTKDQASMLLDAAVNLPEAALGVITNYPSLLADADLKDFASLLNQAIAGDYGDDYPADLAQVCLARIAVDASMRQSDIWKEINTDNLKMTDVDIAGAVLAKTHLTMEQINSAKGYEGVDFRDVELVGFDPSGKSLRGAIMPEDAASARLFRWSTGVRPSPGTIWVDGKRPWG